MSWPAGLQRSCMLMTCFRREALSSETKRESRKLTSKDNQVELDCDERWSYLPPVKPFTAPFHSCAVNPPSTRLLLWEKQENYAYKISPSLLPSPVAEHVRPSHSKLRWTRAILRITVRNQLGCRIGAISDTCILHRTDPRVVALPLTSCCAHRRCRSY